MNEKSPNHSAHDTKQRVIARGLQRETLAFLTVGMVFGTLFVVMQIFQGYGRMAVVSGATAVVAGLLWIAAKRATDPGQVRLIAHAMVGAFCLTAVFESLFGGQAESNALWWIILVPLLASHILGGRAAIAWTVVAAAAAGFVYVSPTLFTITPDGGDPTVAGAAQVMLILLTAVAFLGITFRKVADRHLQGVLDHEEQLRQLTEELEHRVHERTAELRAANQELTKLALYDSLTGLTNRSLFIDHVGMALRRLERSAEHTAVVFFLDLDRFKVVNDSLGHDSGDCLLRAVSTRLRQAIRPTDTLARLGGDEFALLLEDTENVSEAIAVARRVIDTLNAPFEVETQSGNAEVFTTVSIGIAVARDADERPEDLLRHADVAMYRAKGAGGNGFEIFDNKLRKVIRERLDTETALRFALERNELTVHYQAITDVRTGQPSGYEALVRWNRPGHGCIPASEFIDLAEDMGLVVPIGALVLEEATRQARHCPVGMRVHVNISARQLTRTDLCTAVQETLARTQCPPDRLGLEITETVLMADPDASFDVLHHLHDLGVQLSVDDFGTGHSSLSYLKRFPVDTLKIDRSFVAGLGGDAEDTAIVEAVLQLGHTLDLEVVAEGVETGEQLRVLEMLGCDSVQGNLLGSPAPARDTDRLVS